MNWQTEGRLARSQLLSAIPSGWKINHTKHGENVMEAIPGFSILSQKQLKITEMTVTELCPLIASRELTAVEVLQAFAARAAIAHQLVNCLTDWFYEEGLQRAAELDEYLAQHGQVVGPLHGIPVCIKDTYDLKGHATTFGYISKRHQVADRDSAVVTSLRKAGAVFYVKTAMPQTGMALETSSNLWGRTLNPFNTNLVAGGSSGGDAALVALRGSPIAPSTDIGGSIRAPAAFNGLYGMRPTADRIPKGGMRSTESGQISIRVSCGPVCHSVDDLRTFTAVLNAHPVNRYDVTCTPVPWRSVERPSSPLKIGVMKWDGVVMPHPPVIRALEETKKNLQQAGHKVIEFTPPFDCWEVIQTTFDLYFQTGAKETLKAIKDSNEPILPAFSDLLAVYNAREHSAEEILECNKKLRDYKTKFAEAWKGLDALICPSAPSASFPHDFNVYWGYTSLFNILDYPSTILPLKNFRISELCDPIDTSYQPLSGNPYDKPNHKLYHPKTFMGMPMTVQIVGRPFDDEELIEVTAVIDSVVNDSTA